MKKVILLTKYLGTGGVTSHIMTLAEGLVDEGWEVGIVSGGIVENKVSIKNIIANKSITHFTIPEINFGNSDFFLNLPKTMKSFNEFLFKFQPDLIHVHYRQLGIIAKWIERKKKVPFITTLHSQRIPHSYLHKKLSFWGGSVIAISEETKEFLINKFQLNPNRISLIFNGVDEENFYPPTVKQKELAREDFAVLNNEIVICSIGRLVEQKQHEILLRSVANLKKLNIDVKVLIAGNGDYKEILRSLCESLEIKELVNFTGHTDSQKILWASDIQVLTSAQEGFGLVIVEGMLCKVPAIRTATGGALDQISDGIDGYIVEIGSEEQLTKNLKRLIGSNSFRINMGENAFKKAVSRFTKNKMVYETEKVYDHTIRNSVFFIQE